MTRCRRCGTVLTGPVCGRCGLDHRLAPPDSIAAPPSAPVSGPEHQPTPPKTPPTAPLARAAEDETRAIPAVPPAPEPHAPVVPAGIYRDEMTTGAADPVETETFEPHPLGDAYGYVRATGRVSAPAPRAASAGLPPTTDAAAIPASASASPQASVAPATTPPPPTHLALILTAVITSSVAAIGVVAYLLFFRSGGENAVPPPPPSPTAPAPVPTVPVSTPPQPASTPAPEPLPASPEPTPSVEYTPSVEPTPSVEYTPSVDVQEQAEQELQRLYQADRGKLKIDGRWVAVLSSKKHGTVDPLQTAANGSHTFFHTDILAIHRNTLQNHPGRTVLLIRSSDFGRQPPSGEVYWRTVLDDNFRSEEAVRQFCAATLDLPEEELENACMPREVVPPYKK